VTGPVHNPHFFEYQGNFTNVANNNGFGQCNANNLPDYRQLNRICGKFSIWPAEVLKEHEDKKIIVPCLGNQLMEIYRFITHIRYDELGNIDNSIRRLENTMNLRIDYLNNAITKEKMAQKLYQNNKKRVIQTKIRYILDLINQVGSESIWGIINFPEEDNVLLENTIKKEIQKIYELFEYSNKQFSAISFNNKCQSFKIVVDTTIMKRASMAAVSSRKVRLSISIKKTTEFKNISDKSKEYREKLDNLIKNYYNSFDNKPAAGLINASKS